MAMTAAIAAIFRTAPVLLVAAALASAAAAQSSAQSFAQTFDGITIIEFKDSGGAQAIASGDYIVTFVSGRGSYASVSSSGFGGTRRGCMSAAVPGSYTGASIAFGIAGNARERTHRLDTLCPPFTLRFEGADAVRVEAGPNYSQRHAVVARIPFRAIDFGAAHFMRHAVQGVRLGPVTNPAELGPVSDASGLHDRHKAFRREVGTRGYYRTSVHGRAAPAEITGWPWDVLYYARYHHTFEKTVTRAAYRDAIIRAYGAPSSEHREFGYMAWLYDMDGNLLTPSESATGACLRTAAFWVKYDSAHVITSAGWSPNKNDLGAWGCSLIMAINPNRNDHGVTGYAVTMTSGYVLAVSHFFQRLGEPPKVMKKLQEIQSARPGIE